jgi:lipopolysaccharide transport system ATP-binding protein
MVSHNLNSVRRLCERILVVHDGVVRHDGDTAEGLSLYHELLAEPRDDDGFVAQDGPGTIDVASIDNVLLLGPDGAPSHHFEAGDTVTLEATMTVRDAVAHPILGVSVVTDSGTHAYGETWTFDTIEGFAGTGSVRIRISLTLGLATGSYSLYLALGSRSHATIADTPPPILFFVTGRPSVRGVVDLKGRLTSDVQDAADST